MHSVSPWASTDLTLRECIEAAMAKQNSELTLCSMLFVIGSAYRIIAFFLLIITDRHRKR